MPKKEEKATLAPAANPANKPVLPVPTSVAPPHSDVTMNFFSRLTEASRRKMFDQPAVSQQQKEVLNILISKGVCVDADTHPKGGNPALGAFYASVHP